MLNKNEDVGGQKIERGYSPPALLIGNPSQPLSDGVIPPLQIYQTGLGEGGGDEN